MQHAEAESIHVANLQIGAPLHSFLTEEALPGTGIEPDHFFARLSQLLHDFGARNAELLEVRQSMQAAIDGWHREHKGQAHDAAAYRLFLEELGYLVPPGPSFEIGTTNVDAEIALVPGPQLVVPIMNARYAINAANARWGSFYDAIYGTDVLGDLPAAGPYDPARGARVIAYARAHLDDVAPLDGGSHVGSTGYAVVDGAVVVTLADGSTAGLADPSQFAAYDGSAESPSALLLRQNGLGIDLRFDSDHPVGSTDTASMSDIVLESAMTAIMDCEDSVAAVDAEDKALAYHNWLGLMSGTLTEQVQKGDASFTRTLADDRTYTDAEGNPVLLPGRAVMLVRNVGHLMTTPAILDRDGNEVYEGLLDAMVTTLCALHDLSRSEASNSRSGSVYVVKPKMHGPDEVAFANDVFTFVEETLGLPANTVKLGIMDEERRTTVNLAECIRAASDRVAFINTGFLDRTGDEIHTSMQAGPMVPKSEMKAQPWISAYEDWNVDVGLACGLRGKAQIGKGMWAAPDLMANMLEQKIGHPQSGANCAWVPSPTAATLHATHYHRVDVLEVQEGLVGNVRASLDDILTIPLAAPDTDWSAAAVQRELDNNAQGILGYVVRWVDAGVGCSKVPDINDVGLMEDRATCRISSQHMANWLHHGIVDEAQIVETFERMAVKVDAQNAGDPTYVPMAPSYDGLAFKAAKALVLSGVEQPSGYTEPLLHAHRRQLKNS